MTIPPAVASWRTIFPLFLRSTTAVPIRCSGADIFRYLIVAKEGGLYADIDVECLRNVEPLLQCPRAVFGVEDRLSPRRTRQLGLRHGERIANFIFAAEAGHPVFGKIIDRLKRLPGAWDLDREVLETTGPGMLTDVVQEWREPLELTILPRICWAPPNWGYPDCFPFNLHMYARHHFAGTWKANRPATSEQGGFGLREWAPRELLYRLPPSPIWKRDLLFWKGQEPRR